MEKINKMKTVSKKPQLVIQDLNVEVDSRSILKNFCLELNKNSITAIMGPNGSGKSTLSNVVAGNPKYKAISGKILFEGKDLLALKPEERSRLGIFLAFQHPFEIPGINVGHFLYSIAKIHNKDLSPINFRKSLLSDALTLGIEPNFLDRDLNAGFSGGEKKRLEILQLLTIKPKLAILDETDSGLDIDGLKLISKAVSKLRISVLIITHYPRLLSYIKPDKIHVMRDGAIIRSGDSKLANIIEKNGYKFLVGK